MIAVLLKVIREPVIVLLIALGVMFFMYRQSQKKLDRTLVELSVSQNNIKAYAQSLEVWQDKYGQEHAKSLVFQHSIKQFLDSKDSVDRKIVEAFKKQDIKLKALEAILYNQTSIDTIIYKDVNIPTLPDTTIDLSNEHIKNIIHLSPLRVSSEIELDNELYGSFEVKKVTVKPESKIFFIRWFQKKQKVIEADLFNTNPLIKTKSQKIVDIID